MPVFVNYQLQVTGLQQAERAMESFERKAERLNGGRRRSGGSATVAGAGNVRAANANASVKETEAIARAKEKAEERGRRAAEKAAAARAKGDEKAAAQAIKAEERAQRERTRIAEREAKLRAKADEQWSTYNRKQREQHFREEERRQLRSRAQWLNTTKGVVGGTARNVSSFATGALAMAGIGGGALAANALHGYMRDKAAASNLANQVAGKDATVADIQKTKAEVLASAQAIKGISAEEVMRGQSAFHSVAGESEATLKVGQKLTTAHLATGGDIGDIGGMYSEVYASLRNATGGASKTVDQLIEETDKLGRVFAAMGAKGAIELKDFARIGATIGAVSGQYSGDAAENLKYTAAAAQVARQSGGAPSAEEAATAIQSFAADLVQHSSDARLLGVNVFADKGKTKLKQFPEMVAELMAGTGGNLEKIQTVNNIRGVKALRGYSTPYLEAHDAAKAAGKTEKEAKAAGKVAVIEKVKSFASEEYSETRYDNAAKSKLSDEDKILEANMKALNVAVGRELAPAITKLAPQLANLAPYIATAAKMFAQLVSNPLAGLGVIMGAAAAKEVAAAGIGKLLSTTLTQLSQYGVRGTDGKTPGLTSGTTGGKLAAAGAAVGVGLTAFTIAHATLTVLGDLHQGAAELENKGLANTWENYEQKRSQVMGDKSLTEEERANRLSSLGKQTSANVNNAVEADSNWLSVMPDWFRQVFDSGTGMANEKAAAEMQERIAKDQQTAAKMLQDAAAALSSGSGSGAATVPNRGNTKSPVTG
jgi:hypothetical protein